MISRPTTIEAMQAAIQKLGTEEGWQRGLAFRPRPTDVIISPFAKSGTTWLQQIFHGLRTRGSMDFEEITAVTPWIEMAHDIGWDLEADQAAEPRGYKSHLNWYDVPKGGRYVCSIRHPHTVLISFYRFFEGWWFEPGSINLDDFAREMFMNDFHNRGYWLHLVSWWEQHNNPDVLLLCYEEMLADLPGTVQKVANFIGIQLDKRLLDIVVRQSSRNFMLAHREKFGEHIIRAAAEKRAGLPPDGDSSKITPGSTGSARYVLSNTIHHELNNIWQEMVAAKFGFSDYEQLREALKNFAG